MLPIDPPEMRRRSPTWRQETGFTLFELVIVVVILAVLAAVAVPRFISMPTTSRIAAVKTAYGAVSSAAVMANLQCLTTASNCTAPESTAINLPGGGQGTLGYGYPAGMSHEYSSAYSGIKDWVQVQGFTVAEQPTKTDFTNDDAPDPATCKVRYQEIYMTLLPTITMTTTGC